MDLQEYTHENKEGDIIPFYLKHDVDRYINNLKEKVCSMFRDQNKCRGLDFKSVLGQIANVAFHHWLHVEKTEQDLISANRDIELLHRHINTLKNQYDFIINDSTYRIRKQKHKRCLANAETCAWAEDDFAEALEHAWSQTGQEEYERKRDFWKRWKNKWLEIANKFKQ